MAKLVYKSGDKNSKGKPIREIESKVKDTAESRMLKNRAKKTTNVFHIVWLNGGMKIKHLHCKKCQNKWHIKDGLPISEKFLIEKNSVKCKQCEASCFLH